MIFQSLLDFVIIIFILFSAIYLNSSNDSIDFEFNAKNLNDIQKNRLFEYLDKNKDNSLSKTELKTLFRKLFFSTKLNKTLVNETNEEKIFDALNFTSNDQKLGRAQFDKLWNNWIKVILKPRSALIVVDVQNDFIDPTKGSLTVTNGTVIIPVINELIQKTNFDVVVFTKDWHPPNHCSFLESAKKALIEHKILNMSEKSFNDLKVGSTVHYRNRPNLEQKLWPKHCIQNTTGAQLYKDLIKPKNSFEVLKGKDPDIDSYSAFQDNNGEHKTDLDINLQKRGITDVYLTGVVYEFCVGETAKDALHLGYRTAFIENAIQTMNTTARDQMRQNLVKMSANIIQSDYVSDMVSGRDRTVQMGIVLAKKFYKNN